MTRPVRRSGRLINVWEPQVGTTLTADAPAGATSITVDDPSCFDEAGGSLYVGSQVLKYMGYDDETGVVTFASTNTLTAAASADDPVVRWSTLYNDVETVQYAEVAVEGDRDQADTLVVEVADSLDLRNGDRGLDGENCTIERDGDVWRLTSAHGRPSKLRGLKWEDGDRVTLHAGHIGSGTATLTLSHVPQPESFLAWHHFGGSNYAGIDQTDYVLDGSGKTATFPIGAGASVGDVIRVRYPYRKGLGGDVVIVPFEASGWRWKDFADSDSTNRSAPAFDDSSWATAPAAFASSYVSPEYPNAGFPEQSTNLTSEDVVAWLRRDITIPAGVTSATFNVRRDGSVRIYIDGVLLVDQADQSVWPDEANFSATVDVTPGDVLLAVRIKDDAPDPTVDGTYIDVQMVGHQ